jgi:hypothetical protein
VNTYAAGDAGGTGTGADSREWVFGALATPAYRERCDQLAGLDLKRRPGCEPCLQSLVTDEWTAETEHHVGWCDSCRAAAVALGPGVHLEGEPRRRRALWLAVAAGALILVPLVGSQVIGNPFSGHGARGGVAHAVGAAKVVPVARSKTAGAAKAAGAAGGTAIVGVKASARGHAAVSLKASAGAKGAAGVKASAGAKGAVGANAVVGGKVVVVARSKAHPASPLTRHGSRVLPLTT